MRERVLRQCEALRGKIVEALGGEAAVRGGSSGAAPGGEPRRTRSRTPNPYPNPNPNPNPDPDPNPDPYPNPNPDPNPNPNAHPDCNPNPDLDPNQESYAERRGAAFGLAGVVKGLGIPTLKALGIMTRLQEAVEAKAIQPYPYPYPYPYP